MKYTVYLNDTISRSKEYEIEDDETGDAFCSMLDNAHEDIDMSTCAFCPSSSGEPWMTVIDENDEVVEDEDPIELLKNQIERLYEENDKLKSRVKELEG